MCYMLENRLPFCWKGPFIIFFFDQNFTKLSRGQWDSGYQITHSGTFCCSIYEGVGVRWWFRAAAGRASIYKDRWRGGQQQRNPCLGAALTWNPGLLTLSLEIHKWQYQVGTRRTCPSPPQPYFWALTFTKCPLLYLNILLTRYPGTRCHKWQHGPDRGIWEAEGQLEKWQLYYFLRKFAYWSIFLSCQHSFLEPLTITSLTRERLPKHILNDEIRISLPIMILLFYPDLLLYWKHHAISYHDEIPVYFSYFVLNSWLGFAWSLAFQLTKTVNWSRQSRCILGKNHVCRGTFWRMYS